MEQRACASCRVVLGGAPLYSPDGALVCDECHNRLVALDRKADTGRYLAWSALAAGGLGFFFNPYFMLSMTAVSAGFTGFGMARQLRDSGHRDAARLQRDAVVGAALGIVCTLLGGLNVWWKARAPDPQLLRQASQLAESSGGGSACRSPEACRVLGERLAGEGDHKAAREPLERACEMKNGRACYLLANFYDSGAVGAVDRARAAELYGLACKLNQAEACGSAESLLEQVALEAIPNDIDGAMLRRLVEAGSDLSKPHAIDLFVYLPHARAARAAASELEKLGFQVATRRSEEDARWLCVASKTLVPEHAVMAGLRTRVSALAAEHRGEYDGWEAGLVR